MIETYQLIDLFDDESLRCLLGVVHDALYEFIDDEEFEPTPEILVNIIYSLPKGIILEIMEWGANDTVVRESIHEHIKINNLYKLTL